MGKLSRWFKGSKDPKDKKITKAELEKKALERIEEMLGDKNPELLEAMEGLKKNGLL